MWLSRCITKSQYRILGAQELHRVGRYRFGVAVNIDLTHVVTTMGIKIVCGRTE